MKNTEGGIGWRWIAYSIACLVICLCLVALGFVSFWIGNFFDTLSIDSQVSIFIGVMFLVFWGIVIINALDSDDDIDSGPGGPL